MSVHIPLANHQRPCALCGQDAFTEQGARGQIALTCARCNLLMCVACSGRLQTEENISTYGCPTCHESVMPVRLDTTLRADSVWLMPPQALEGWPDLTATVYHGMADRVCLYLPVILASLEGLVPDKDLPAVRERLCFALATGKYLEWCYNHQEDVRAFHHGRERQDFATPALFDMVELIKQVIAANRRT